MIKLEIPIEIKSEMNLCEHWTKKYKRHKNQQLMIRLAFQPYENSVQLPCVVTLSRLSPRLLDDDNLVAAMKYIRDEIADIILPDLAKTYIDRSGRIKNIKGRSDSDPRIKWQYSQEKCKFKGVRIEVEY